MICRTLLLIAALSSLPACKQKGSWSQVEQTVLNCDAPYQMTAEEQSAETRGPGERCMRVLMEFQQENPGERIGPVLVEYKGLTQIGWQIMHQSEGDWPKASTLHWEPFFCVVRTQAQADAADSCAVRVRDQYLLHPKEYVHWLVHDGFITYYSYVE